MVLAILTRVMWFRRGWIALLLPGLLSACGASVPSGMDGFGQTISLLVEEENLAAPLNRIASREMMKEQIIEFERYHPGTQVQLEVVRSDGLGQALQYRASRGLEPDLLLLVGNDLLPLKSKGYIKPVRLSEQERLNFRPEGLLQLQNHGEQLGLPLFLYPRLACYNKQLMPEPPKTQADLIRLGQQGHAIGLDSSFPGLQWLYSGFGGNLFPPQGERFNSGALLDFLSWLRLANLQPDITFVTNGTELSQGLGDGHFQWVSCSTRWLPSLRKALGSRLGLSLLPGGPKEAAQPILHLRTWAFGAQSSSKQHQLARQLVLFNSNVVQQRNMALKLGTVLPVNPAIALPLKAYPTLGLIDEAVRSSRRLNLAQERQFQALEAPAQTLIDQVISGGRPPEWAAPKLEALIKAAQPGVQR